MFGYFTAFKASLGFPILGSMVYGYCICSMIFLFAYSLRLFSPSSRQFRYCLPTLLPAFTLQCLYTISPSGESSQTIRGVSSFSHTTVSFPFPGFTQPSALFSRFTFPEFTSLFEHFCHVCRVLADQIHIPEVIPTRRDMKILSISTAILESSAE